MLNRFERFGRIKVLTDKEPLINNYQSENWQKKFGDWAGWLGLGLLVILTAAWLLTFPTLQLLSSSLSGSRAITVADREPSFIGAFFRSFPQLVWLGFVLAAGLYFWFRPKTRPKLNEEITEPARLQIAGYSRKLPQWVNITWRGLGIAALLVILLVAATMRAGDARNIGVTDLVAADYDESVYATTALLITRGKTSLYQDFFSSQPPLGFWLWSLPLRFGNAEWGGLDDFLRMRFFTTLLSLVTIGFVYMTGRRLGGRWAGPIAGGVAGLALAVDGGAIRLDQQVMLEPLINFFSAAALFVFVSALNYQPSTINIKRVRVESSKSLVAGGWLGVGKKAKGMGQWAGEQKKEVQNLKSETTLFLISHPLFLVLAGALVGAALSVKLAALALFGGLAITLLIWRLWKAFGLYLAGVAASYLLFNGFALLTSGSEYLKQVLLYQFLRPSYRLALVSEFRSETELTALAYIASAPYLAFTLLASGLGLAAIVLRWITRRDGEMWLPVVMVASLTIFLYVGKAGFFPHYYAQMALPLALLAGGIINFWRPEWWRSWPKALASTVGGLVIILVLWPGITNAGNELSKPVWSWERSAGRTFANLNLQATSVFTLDPRFSFVMGLPMPTDAYGKYWVENSAYTEYLGLGMDKQGLGATLKRVFLDPKPDKEALRQLRYSPVVQENLLKTAAKADYFIVESGAESQITKQTQQALQRDFISRDKNTRFEILDNALRTARYPSGALFGDKMRLVAFNTAPEIKLAPGAKVPLTIFWRSENKMEEDYVIFFYLYNEAGEKVAQRDTAPRYGALNTSSWQPGTLLDDDQSLPLPDNLAPGRYKIIIGVYRPGDFQRLNITQAPTSQPTPDGNSIVLMEVVIK